MAAFIATRLHVEKSGDYRLLAGGDDTLHMRLDGARLLAQDRCFPLTDSLLHYPVALTAGDHWLVVRVTQLDKRWEMHFEVQNADASTATTVWGLPAEP